MPRWVKLVYAVIFVLPLVKELVVHLITVIPHTYKEVKEKWNEAWRGP